MGAELIMLSDFGHLGTTRWCLQGRVFGTDRAFRMTPYCGSGASWLKNASRIREPRRRHRDTVNGPRRGVLVIAHKNRKTLACRQDAAHPFGHADLRVIGRRQRQSPRNRDSGTSPRLPVRVRPARIEAPWRDQSGESLARLLDERSGPSAV